MFAHWLSLPEEYLAFNIWRLSTDFTYYNRMASSFLKGDLSGTSPWLPHIPPLSLFLVFVIRSYSFIPGEEWTREQREARSVAPMCFFLWEWNRNKQTKKIPIKAKSFMETWGVRNNSPHPRQPITHNPTCPVRRMGPIKLKNSVLLCWRNGGVSTA